jgi:organic radical activating enzyme
MFGANPTRKLDRGDGLVLQVQQVFSTVQGEGPFAGLPATFIRLWGCHLKCFFCDTDFESSQTAMSVTELVKHCVDGDRGPRLVVLTGGEPMRQNILPLCDALHEAGHVVQVETAGSFWFQSDHFATRAPNVVISPKTARVDERLARVAQAWKYIISTNGARDEYDGLPIADFQSTGNTAPLARPPQGTPPEFVWVQPMDEQGERGNRLNMQLCVELAKAWGYRISLQQHKILGVP